MNCPHCNRPMQSSAADSPRVWACEPCSYVSFAGLPVMETLIERKVCPECLGTGFANHYLTTQERECWKCHGQGEIYEDTNMVPNT